MDFTFGFISGSLVGFGFAIYFAHKSEISYIINCLKEDLTIIQVKLDKLLNKQPL